MESLNAISGLSPLCIFNIRFSVEAATPSFEAKKRQLKPKGSI
jgi:hypothetical protein